MIKQMDAVAYNRRLVHRYYPWADSNGGRWCGYGRSGFSQGSGIWNSQKLTPNSSERPGVLRILRTSKACFFCQPTPYSFITKLFPPYYSPYSEISPVLKISNALARVNGPSLFRLVLLMLDFSNPSLKCQIKCIKYRVTELKQSPCVNSRCNILINGL